MLSCSSETALVFSVDSTSLAVGLLLCNCNSLGWFFLAAIVDSPCDSDLLVICDLVEMLSFSQLCFASSSCFPFAILLHAAILVRLLVRMCLLLSVWGQLIFFSIFVFYA